MPALGGKTTIEAARTPNLDRLAADGMCGLMAPIAPGIRAGSDTSHLALLGYDPHSCYTGRGPFECAGIGMKVGAGDVAFRCNFATVDARGVVRDRRAGRISKGTDKLAAALNAMQIGDVTCFVKESVAHRAGLVLRGPGLDHNVTDVDPHDAGQKYATCRALKREARKTAEVVNEFVERSREILSQHPVNRARVKAGEKPANALLPRGVGMAPHLPSFRKTQGMRGAMIVETGLIRGIGFYVGLRDISVPGATGGYDTNYDGFAEAILRSARRSGFILVNVKSPDIGGHDGEPEAKIDAIESVDGVVGQLLDGLDFEHTLLIVSADHATPVSVGDHSGDLVPIVFYGHGVTPDRVERYGERPCSAGLLGVIRGRDIVNIATNLLAVQEKYGA